MRKKLLSFVAWIVARKYKLICVVLMILILLSARSCSQYRYRLDLLYGEIESRNRGTIVEIAEVFRHGEHHDLLLLKLGKIEAYSHLIVFGGQRKHPDFSAYNEWRVFVELILRFANEDLFNALTQEQRLYIRDTLMELQTYRSIKYGAFDYKFGGFILEIYLDFHGID